MTRLERLRHASADEIAWRLQAVGRVQADRAFAAVRQPRWHRETLRGVLARHAVTPSLARAVAQSDWRPVHDELLERLLARKSAFPIDYQRARELTSGLVARWGDAPADAAARADRLLAGQYDLLGYRALSFAHRDGGIDWHLDPVHRRRAPLRFWADVPYLEPGCGDHKIIWELNRHQHWLAFGRALWLTGDRRYAAGILRELASWLDANPPLMGINWASMLELAFRILSWVSALHFLLAGDPADEEGPWIVDLLLGLDRQLTQVERNLSYYFSPNTHLTGEALALYVAGHALPELGAAARWTRTGRSVLLGEIDRQIGSDGGHLERSTHYHRYTLDFYLLALLVAERAGDVDATASFREAVDRLATFMHAMAADNGRLPMLGDDDGGMLWPLRGPEPADVRASLALAAVVLERPGLAPWGLQEEAWWLGWGTFGSRMAAAAAPALGAGVHGVAASLVFPDTGYAVMKDGRGSQLIFDVGEHGYLNAGHAHADALAVTVMLEGRPLLVDPGTATYTMDAALRDRLRSSMSHNTLTLDGRSPSEPAGPFHWRSRTDAILHDWRANPQFAWAEGWHDGYASGRHRRTVVACSLGWVVLDEVLGTAPHRAEAYWHFDPTWAVQKETARRLRAQHFDGAVAWLVHDGDEVCLSQADDESWMGWCSPAYGTLVPCWTARIARTARSPFALATWILPAERGEVPRLDRLALEGERTAGPLGVRLVQGDFDSVLVLWPGDEPARETRTCTAGEYQTNGRLFRYATRADRLVTLELTDASDALALREGWLSVAADERMADLHVSAAPDRLELWSSAPASRLRLQGAALRALTELRLNGREARPAFTGSSDSIVIDGSNWGAPQISGPAPHAAAAVPLSTQLRLSTVPLSPTS